MLRSQKEQRSFHRNCRRYFREYSEITGIHGLRYIAEKRTLTEKILWTTVLLASLGCCVYMIDEIWSKYCSSPVVISFSNKDTPIFQIPFPAVTICPETKCSKNKFNFSDVYWRINQSESVTPEEWDIFEYMKPLCDDIFDEATSNQTLDEDFFRIIRKIQPEDLFTIESCYWLGVAIDCQANFLPIVTDQGLCYSFNIVAGKDVLKPNIYIDPQFNRSAIPKTNFDLEYGYNVGSKWGEDYPYRAYLSGIENSLTVRLWQYNYNSDFLCKESSQGFRVQIHNPFTVPRLDKDYFSVALNRQVVAAIRPHLVTTSENVKRFSQEKRECFLYNERKLTYFEVYTQENCYLDCWTSLTLEKCGCVNFYMPKSNETLICGNAKRYCLMEAEFHFKGLDIETKLGPQYETYCNCQPLCSDLKYDSETSHNFYDMKQILQANREYDLLEKIDDGVVVSKLSIYFKEEQFTSLERHQLYGITDLISNFGGILGLFTGFSILSLVEVFYFGTVRVFCNRRLYGVWAGPQ